MASLACASVEPTSAGEFYNAWHSANSAIVLDAYEYTPIDWSKMGNNKRLAGFINKGSDGLAPKHRCKGNQLCRVKWRRYAATRELYHTRKVLAKSMGMKWGAYHLARPGNPIAQAEHFLQFTKPGKDDLLALDIEHNDPSRWMSMADGEIFARHIKMRTGRYPVLYTNHSTSKFIANHRAKYPLLSRLNLWYARYKADTRGVFPMGNWNSYTIWQFSSMVNCNDKTCPWRINGAGNWIDVNVVAMSPEKLKSAWPFAKLRAGRNAPTEVYANSNNAIDTTTTASIKNVSASGTRVKLASFESDKSSTKAPVMAITGAGITPKWRPGSVFVKRIPFRTSDEILIEFYSAQAPKLQVDLKAWHRAAQALHRLPSASVVAVAQRQLARNKSAFPGEL